MIEKILGAVAVCAPMILSSAPAEASDSKPACPLTKVIDMSVMVTPGNAVLADGSIKGEPIKLQIDTGSYATIFDEAVIKKFGVSDSGKRGSAYGIGGDVKYIRAKIPEFKISGSNIDMYFNVMDAHFLPEPIYGLLGEDFLGSFDLDLDFHSGRIGLYNYVTCSTEPIYWADTFSEADLSVQANKIHVMVELNGVPTRALLDTGANRTVVTAGLAQHLGIASSSPGTTKGPDTRGVDGRIVPTFRYRFAELKVGDEIVKNPTLLVANIAPRKFDHNSMARIQDKNYGDESMILGVDFIRQHHIYIATRGQKMYFTWNGGSIFAPPAEDAAAAAATNGK